MLQQLSKHGVLHHVAKISSLACMIVLCHALTVQPARSTVHRAIHAFRKRGEQRATGEADKRTSLPKNATITLQCIDTSASGRTRARRG